ncbi:hypothetical protein CCP3SC5AM1_3260002 [Gammaproteobacteria bacterium]
MYKIYQRIVIHLGKFNHPITGAIRVRIMDDGEVDIIYTINEVKFTRIAREARAFMSERDNASRKAWSDAG